MADKQIMKKSVKVLIPVALGLALICAGIIILSYFNSGPAPEEDEIKVNIRLDLDEDIGLLLIDYDMNGADGAGGISNADKSMLKKDSKDLYWSFDKSQLDTPADTVNAALNFTAVTEYFAPNYDNIYPEEYTVPMGDITFSADFGEIYRVIITGNKTNGYNVVMD